jgi:hypothetical protein
MHSFEWYTEVDINALIWLIYWGGQLFILCIVDMLWLKYSWEPSIRILGIIALEILRTLHPKSWEYTKHFSGCFARLLMQCSQEFRYSVPSNFVSELPRILIKDWSRDSSQLYLYLLWYKFNNFGMVFPSSLVYGSQEFWYRHPVSETVFETTEDSG